jgi:hypothetical protein
MIHLPRLLSAAVIAAVLLWLTPPSARADNGFLSYAPKLGLRFNFGLLRNAGTEGGPSVMMWGANLLGLYFPNPVFAVGMGYRSIFDMTGGTTPVSGLFLTGRWYFSGEGTRSNLTAVFGMNAERRQAFAFYTGAELGNSDYYLGEGAEGLVQDRSLSGRFIGVDALIGLDVALGKSFEVNIEGSYGLLTFSGSDERFRIQGMVLNAGISYLW